VVVGLLVLVTVGAVFEQIGQHHDRRRYPQIGNSIDIGGRTLNISCLGEGGPTVIFDTYGHMSGYAWSAVQAEVAKSTRACWYDRAAYGWSEPGPMPRTYQSVASDLHALLHAASVSPPYVLAGASEAALHIRLFNGLYPGEIRGVVMVNAMDGDGPQTTVPESTKGFWGRHFGSVAPRIRGLGCLVFPTLTRVGVIRLVGLFQPPRGTPEFGLAPEQRPELDFLSDNSTAVQGSEACTRAEGAEQVRAAGNLGDLPLIVLASQEKIPAGNPAQRAIAAAWNEAQIKRVQPGLAKLSTRGRLVSLDDDVTARDIIGAIREVSESTVVQRH
jgi:hypothetical protein